MWSLLSLRICVTICLSVRLPFSLLSACVLNCLFISIFLLLSHISLSVFLPLSLSPPPLFCLSSLSFSVSFSVSLCVSLSVCLCLSISLSLSFLFHSHTEHKISMIYFSYIWSHTLLLRRLNQLRAQIKSASVAKGDKRVFSSQSCRVSWGNESPVLWRESSSLEMNVGTRVVTQLGVCCWFHWPLKARSRRFGARKLLKGKNTGEKIA